MTDDPLDRLRKALTTQTPPPSEGAKDAAVAAALAEFSARRQGSAETARPMSDRPEKRGGFWTGVTAMLNNVIRPRILMGTSALATVALAMVLTQTLDLGPTAPPRLIDTPAKPATTGQTGRDEVADLTTQPLIESVERESFEDREAAEDGGGVLRSMSRDNTVMDATREAIEPRAKRLLIPDRDDVELLRRLEPQPQSGPGTPHPLGSGATPYGDIGAELGGQLASPPPAPQYSARPQADAQDAPPGVVSAPGVNQSDLLGIEEVTPPAASQLRVIRPESPIHAIEQSTESYPQAAPNPLKLTSEEPVSTFSIDVDTASYALIRSSLNRGQMPPEDAVRVEEVINYFDYVYPMPDSPEVPFATSVSIAQTPWNPDTRLMHIGIQGYDLAPQDRPPLNLVFLIDTSGSMNDSFKLPLLIQSFKLLLDSLSGNDSVAIVTYAGSAGMALEPTPASDRATILRALTNLRAGGSTAGQAGLQQAYALAGQMSEDGEVSRVILATDGDFNVGISDPEALKDYIADQRESGTYLSVLGFGRGNYQDTTMQALAQNGNGIAAYIDSPAEAHKVLVEDVTGSLFPIAGDVKIQVEFNPAQISEYRLIGYETRALNREDFNDDTVDAGEIGAGHQVTALYEITPTGSPAERISGLRYAQEPETAVDDSAEYAFLKLRYKRPGEGRSNLIETPVLPDRVDIDPQETRFAAAAAGFGMLLRGETLPGWSHDDARALAVSARGDDPYGYRSEMVSLIRIADALD